MPHAGLHGFRGFRVEQARPPHAGLRHGSFSSPLASPLYAVPAVRLSCCCACSALRIAAECVEAIGATSSRDRSHSFCES